MKKSSKVSKKVIKKQPFEKHASSGAMGLIVALTVFNLVYSYAVGLPLPRAVVASYVESVYELGDAQERAYNTMGAAIVTTINTVGRSVAFPIEEEGEVSTRQQAAAALAEADEGPSEPLLLIATNQISVAK